MHSHSQPEVSDDSRYFSLHEYAEKFKNGILDAHAKAFDPDGMGFPLLAITVMVVLIPD